MSPSIYSVSRQSVPVEVQGVGKMFGKQRVLQDVSFRVEAGETFVIMGPSGCGKSVLLKTIIGLEPPTEGQVRIDGKDMTHGQSRRGVIASMVFQAGALLNSLTVFDNLALYPRENRLFDAPTLKDRVLRTLRILGISGAESKYPSELSGGMKKRVAIARALMMEPQLILYDEPTSELDPLSSASIAEIIATLKVESRVTSIVVTHDRDLACAVGDRIAVIFDGRLHAIETPQSLLESEDTRVREFLSPTIDISNPRFRKNT